MEERISMMATLELRTAAPFNRLFPIKDTVLDQIAADMKANGYDYGHPIIVWAGHKVMVVDGHTRLKAALKTGLSKVPITLKEFASEDEALQYAIRAQSNRRNLTDAELMNCLAELDKRKPEGRPPKTPPSGGVSGISAATTANVLGISQRKVERIRTVQDHALPEIKKAVASGAMSVNRAYNETMRRRREDEVKATEPPTGEALQKMKNARLEAIRISMVKMTAARFEREIQEYPEIGYSPNEKERIKQEIIMAVEKYIDSLPNQEEN